VIFTLFVHRSWTDFYEKTHASATSSKNAKLGHKGGHVFG